MKLLSEAAPLVGTMKSKWRLRSNRRHFFLFFTRVLMKLYERSNYGNYGISYYFSNDFARRYCICIICCNLYSLIALKLKADLQGLLAFDIFYTSLNEMGNKTLEKWKENTGRKPTVSQWTSRGKQSDHHPKKPLGKPYTGFYFYTSLNEVINVLQR